MGTDWRYKLKKKLIEFEDGKATICQIEELVEEIISLKTKDVVARDSSRNGICAYATCNKYSANRGFCEEHLKLQPPRI